MPALWLAAAAPDAARQVLATDQARAMRLAQKRSAAQREQAAAAMAEAVAAKRIDAAAGLRTLEMQVLETAQRWHLAAAAERQADTEIDRRMRDLLPLLPLMLRLSRYPAETMLAAAAPPEQALEGLLITHGIAAEAARDVIELRRRQAEASALKATVARQQAALAGQRARQRAEAAALDRQLADARRQARDAQNEAAQAAEAASVLAAKAADLRHAIAAMAAASARARVAAAGPGLASGGQKITLVAGHVVRGWGAAAEDGPATGVTFATAPAAFVASPCTGRIGYAAPFRGYGRLMIIECGRDFDFVLAGLDRLEAAVGTTVRVGEPVGRMPDFDPTATDKPGLYVELRHAGQPIDPLPYLNR